MELMIRPFSELTAQQVYEILLLRSDIFIVEQQGCYLDPDRIDYESIHIFCQEADGSVSGCLRLFPVAQQPGTVQIGRVAVRCRRQGLGRRLMDTALQTARQVYGAKRLFLTGRRSARQFYEACGYTASLPEEFKTEEEATYFDFTRSL